ncbi:MAG: autotransporter-associated beta strand repeat-containing protein [Planctomycetota bacterium]|nr:autotransporter-associated beta strand repeat-containing protein [Planctomycetota bacterium]
MASDAAGNLSAASTSTDHTVIYDITAPASTITNTTGGWFHGTLAGSSSDSGGAGLQAVHISIQKVAGMYYSANGAFDSATAVWLPTDGTLPAWTFAVAAGQLTDGSSYVVSTLATDAVGNVQATPTTGTFTYDATPPLSTITFPSAAYYNATGWAAGTLGGSSSDNTGVGGVTSVAVSILNNTTRQYYGGATFTSGTPVWLSADGTLPAWTYALAADKLANGSSYTVSSRAVDRVENVQSPVTTTSFTYDTTAPQVTVNRLTTNDTQPALSGTVDDPTATVTVTVNTKIYTATNAGDGRWTLALAGQAISPELTGSENGTSYDVTVVATDPAGNPGSEATLGELVIKTGATPTVGVTAATGGGSLLLAYNPSSSGEAVLTQGTTLLLRQSAASSFSLTIAGTSGDDTLTVDFSGGAPVPLGGITFDGGAGFDTVALINVGASYTTQTYNYTNANDGSIVLNNGTTNRTIHYTGLEPITNDGTVDYLIFNLPGLTDAGITLVDLGNGQARLDSPTNHTFEQTNFNYPSASAPGGGSITINLGANDQTLTVSSLALNANTSLIVDGQDGNDTVNLDVTGGLTVTKDLTLTAETIAQTTKVVVSGTTTLAAGATHSISLATSTNDFGTVAITSANDVTLVDTNGIVLGASAIAGNLNLTASGTITQSGTLTANGAGKTATFAAGSGNDITLNAGNDFTTVVVTSGRNVSLRDTDAANLGSTTVTGLLTFSGGTFNLTASNAIASAASVQVDAGTLDLHAYTNTVTGVILNGGTLAGTGGGTLTSTTAYDVRSGASSAILAGSVNLNKTTTGSVTLSGPNTYSGTTSVTAGSLVLGNATALGSTVGGTTVASGAVLDLYGQNVGAESVTLDGTGISSGGALINSSGTAASLSGNIPGNTYSVGGTGNITFTGTGRVQGTLTKVGGNTLTLGGTQDNSSLTAIVTTGTLLLAKSSSATVHALGSGATALTINNGATVQLAGNGGDQLFYQSDVVVNASGILDLNGQPEGFDALTGAGTITNTSSTAAVLTIGQGNTDATYSGTLQNGVGTLALVKTGTATQTLSSATAQTYTGGTTVSGGTLRLTGGDNRLSATGSITVNGGGLDLGGYSQAIATTAAVSLQSGSIAAGTLVYSGAAYDLQSGSALANLTGSAGINKTTSGTVLLGGSNTYTGATNIVAGTLRLPGLVAGAGLWLDASDSSSITQTANSITRWADKSGSVSNGSRDATASGTASPTYATNTTLLNGKSVVQFDGTTDVMNVNLSFLAGNQYTILAVEGRMDSASSRYFLATTANSQNNALHIGYRNNTTYTLAQYSNDLNAPVDAYSTQQFRLWSDQLSAAGHTIYRDGLPIAANTNTTPLTTATGGLIGGADFVIGVPPKYKGELAEIIVFPSALSTADRQAAEAYLRMKWLASTTSALPVGTAVSIGGGATLDLGAFGATIGSLANYNGTGGTVTSTAFNGTDKAKVTLTLAAADNAAFSGSIQEGLTSSVSLTKTGAATQTLSASTRTPATPRSAPARCNSGPITPFPAALATATSS